MLSFTLSAMCLVLVVKKDTEGEREVDGWRWGRVVGGGRETKKERERERKKRKKEGEGEGERTGDKSLGLWR